MSESTLGRGPSRGARRRERATAAKAPAATPVTLTPRTWRLVELLVLATLAILALYAASQDVTGEDLWWHLATGRYILEHGEIPTRDVFSFTYAGAPWFNQEWLAQVLFFDLFRRGGGTALVAFKVLVAAALFPAAAWLGWRRSGSWLLSAGPAIAAAFVCRPYLDIRPQLFSFVGLLAVVAIVDAYRRGAHATLLALLPPTMALWSNLHASFIYGLGTLVLLAGGELLKAARRLPDAPMPLSRAFGLAAAVVVAGFACLLNHEGTRAFTFPFEILRAEGEWRTGIVEWLPPVLFRSAPFNPASFGPFFVAQAVLAVAVLLAAARRFDLSDSAHVAMTGVMAFSARRFVPLFALVAVPFAAKNLAILRDRFLVRRAALSGARGATAVVALCLALLAAVIPRWIAEARQTYADGLFEGMVREWVFPRGAVEFLERNPLPGRLFHVYAWGGYLLYRLPDRPVFIDPRAHTVYPGEFFHEARTVESGEPEWSDVLDRHEVALVVWPSAGFAGELYGRLLAQLAASPSWQRVYDDNHSAVFAHLQRGRAWIDAYRAFRLAYPDNAGAQLFLANAYLDANEFERARVQMREVLRRFPGAAASIRRTEERLLGGAGSSGSPDAWFGVGFSREVRGDGARAVEAYRTALERGLSGPAADYARDALPRLEPAPGG